MSILLVMSSKIRLNSMNSLSFGVATWCLESQERVTALWMKKLYSQIYKASWLSKKQAPDEPNQMTKKWSSQQLMKCSRMDTEEFDVWGTELSDWGQNWDCQGPEDNKWLALQTFRFTWSSNEGREFCIWNWLFHGIISHEGWIFFNLLCNWHCMDTTSMSQHEWRHWEIYSAEIHEWVNNWEAWLKKRNINVFIQRICLWVNDICNCSLEK